MVVASKKKEKGICLHSFNSWACCGVIHSIYHCVFREEEERGVMLTEVCQGRSRYSSSMHCTVSSFSLIHRGFCLCAKRRTTVLQITFQKLYFCTGWHIDSLWPTRTGSQGFWYSSTTVFFTQTSLTLLSNTASYSLCFAVLISSRRGHVYCDEEMFHFMQRRGSFIRLNRLWVRLNIRGTKPPSNRGKRSQAQFVLGQGARWPPTGHGQKCNDLSFWW